MISTKLQLFNTATNVSTRRFGKVGILMIQITTSAKTFFNVIKQILLAVSSCAIAFLLMKFTALSLLLSSIEMNEIQTHAVKGVAGLLSFSFGYVIYVSYVEKRAVVELSFRGWQMFYGLIAGATIISITTLPLFALGYYQVMSYQPFNEIPFALVGLTTQAVFGAILFTGIFFRIIEQHIGTKQSLLSLSIALGLLNILVDGPDLMVFISSILISALWFSIYVLSRNLWVVGLTNGAWLSAVFATGILDEHWRASAPVISSYDGPTLLTGGQFGPEHSIITMAIVSMCICLLLSAAKSKGLWLKN